MQRDEALARLRAMEADRPPSFSSTFRYIHEKDRAAIAWALDQAHKLAAAEQRIAAKDAARDRIVEHCKACIVNVVAVENVAKEGRSK